MSHVSDGETTKWGILREDLNDHLFLWDKFNHSGITSLDVLGLVFSALTGTFVDLGTDLLELAGNVSSVAIENWGISVLDLTWVVQDNNLSNEHFSVLCRVILGVGGDITSLDVLD